LNVRTVQGSLRANARVGSRNHQESRILRIRRRRPRVAPQQGVFLRRILHLNRGSPSRGVNDAPKPAVGHDHFRPSGGIVMGDRCYATVVLDEELRRSMAARDLTHEVSWVHRCALEHGHLGDHRAPAYRDGPLSYWLRWDETCRPGISTTDGPDPHARMASPRGAPSGEPQHADRPTRAEHTATTAAEPAGSTATGSQAEALWAIAAALERLADVIVGALNPAEASGRHAAGREMRQRPHPHAD
jgi:hypothetical protein